LFFLPFSFVSAQTQDSTDIPQNNTISDINTVIFDTNNAVLDAEIVNIDTNTPKTKIHSPKIAGWMSAGVPGLGQIYNKKYWKLPIVYGILGGMGCGIAYFAINYVECRNAYRYRLNHHDSVSNFKKLSTANLNAVKQDFQRNMELFIIFTAVAYFFNILDAVVDAHLMYFNVSDDLSLNILPSIGLNNYLLTNTKLAPNITFTINFR
jgi:TM2 domain-containing membrane protein YozV